MERSITQAAGLDGTGVAGRPPASGAARGGEASTAGAGASREALDAARATARRRALLTGLLLVVLCLGVYLVSRPIRWNYYVHFVWQAQAWLDGQTSIPIGLPATSTAPANDYYQDVMPVLDAGGHATGRGIIPFPPLPALVLLPFVAVWHLGTDEQLLSMILGALDVGLAYWILGALPIRPGVRALTGLFVGLGSAMWYTASTGTTWYWAHVVAVACTLLAVGIALRRDEGLRGRAPPRFARFGLDGWQILAGFLLGLAVASRLTVIFGFPFLVLVGGGRSWFRRGLAAGIGMALPIAGLLVYTKLSTGDWFNPAYEYLYRMELGYTFLNYHADWSITDVRYIPQNLGIMLVGMPDFLPSRIDDVAACAGGGIRALWDAYCPVALPNGVGTGLLLTSPAYLLAPLALARRGLLDRFAAWRPAPLDRLVVGAATAVVAIAVVNLMHFSQGWVQFGYRFANDFMPFAIVLLALGANRVRRLWPFAALVAVSIAVNLWGVAMGAELGW